MIPVFIRLELKQQRIIKQKYDIILAKMQKCHKPIRI